MQERDCTHPSEYEYVQDANMIQTFSVLEALNAHSVCALDFPLGTSMHVKARQQVDPACTPRCHHNLCMYFLPSPQNIYAWKTANPYISSVRPQTLPRLSAPDDTIFKLAPKPLLLSMYITTGMNYFGIYILQSLENFTSIYRFSSIYIVHVLAW